MSKKTHKIIVLSVLWFTFSVSSVYACTAFMLKTKEGIVTGRTLDYDQPSVYNTKTYKSGSTIQSVLKPTPPTPRFSWKVKHDFIVVNNVLSDPAGYLVAFEGMNKAGISISGNLAGASYPNGNKTYPTLSSDDIVRYVLSLASDIDEVKSLLSKINIKSSWQYHYIIFDKSGHSLVVEFKNNAVKYTENETKILTNNPNLNYQLENLNNYANLKNFNSKSITPGSGNQFHGAGMFGLPGDWMSPSRFIRGSIMIKEGQKFISTTKEAVNLAAKIVDSVSLIKGIDLGKTETSIPIYTQIQIIKDLNNSKLYLKRYDDFEWTLINFNNSTDIDAGPISGNKDAKIKCPNVCSASSLKWNGQWTTTIPNEMSVCGCI